MNSSKSKPAGKSTQTLTSGSADLPDDPRLMQAVDEYFQQLQAGQTLSRAEFLLRYPDIAVPLAQCLDGLEIVHKAAIRPRQTAVKPSWSVLADDRLPANPLGDFQIVREIGHGGMGVVYEAVQLSLGRRVALKVLPLAATFDAKHLQRFRNEAQAAAALDHKNIVPVYAVGCERGVHFYAMQLIDGQTLAEVLVQIRGSDPQTVETAPLARALSTSRSTNKNEFYRAIARLMVQVAEGLEHAHQFGIIHRDIKPANLLVDAQGRLWITDFGLAQFHADDGLTRTGDILGTLRYMSPEQASGRRVLLDHRTDIYSLGATLYQLVTLEPMFSGQNQQELLHQILHEEPRAPRAVEKSAPVELETIILKAVSKNPGDRYASAKEFAADLERYLQDRPIHAKRPGSIELARKWLRRHPSFAVVTVFLLFFGVIGFGVSTFIVAGAYGREKKRAEEAEQRFNLARRSADEMIRIAQEDLADNPMMQEIRRRLLEAALVYYQEFIEQRRENPEAQAELAQTRDLVKTILNDLAMLQGAGRHFLLKEPAVINELALDTEQRAQLTQLFERMDQLRQDSFNRFLQLAPEERQKQFLEVTRRNEETIVAILNPAQLDRLRQIAWQCHGPMAFRDPFIESELKLTAEQKRLIHTFESGKFFDPPPPFDRTQTGPGKALAERRKSVMNQILKILTETQTNRWNELCGRPFASAGQIFLPPGPFLPGRFMPPPRNEKPDSVGPK